MGTAPSRPAQPFPVFAHPSRPITLRRIALIVNPRGGGGKGATVGRDLAARLTAEGYDVTVKPTAHAGHAIALAAGCVGFDAVCSVGGDGTAHEVANGLIYGALLRAQGGGPVVLPALCTVPCGSGNTLAFNLGIVTVEDAVRGLTAARVHDMDVVECRRADEDWRVGCAGVTPLSVCGVVEAGGSGDGGASTDVAATAPTGEALAALRGHLQYSVNMVGWGLSSGVLAAADSFRACGGAQYNCAAYSMLVANNSWLGKVEYVRPGEPRVIDGEAYAAARAAIGGGGGSTGSGSGSGSGSGAGAMVMADSGGGLVPVRPVPGDLHPYVMIQVQTTTYMGDKMAFCPLALLDDGWFDMCAVSAGSRLSLISAMDAGKAYGRHVLGQPREATPHPAITYAQAKEVVLRPATAEETGAWLATAGAAGVAANVAAEPMLGDHTVNVDGDLCGFTPLRLVICPRALPVVTWGV